MKNKAFTLTEIMIMVVIMGLLAATAVRTFQKVEENRRTKGIPQSIQIISAQTGAVIMESRVKEITSRDNTQVKWIDTDGMLHEQPIGKDFTYHLIGNPRKTSE